MNIFRSISKLQRQILEGIVAGRQRYLPAEGYRCACGWMGPGPNGNHYAAGKTLDAVKTLEQRGFLAADEDGVLALAGPAVKAFRGWRPPISDRSCIRR